MATSWTAAWIRSRSQRLVVSARRRVSSSSSSSPRNTWRWIGLLLRLDVLVEPPELHVVAGQQRAALAQLRLDHGDLLRHRLVAQRDLLERAHHRVVAA